tara:strand:- start:115 stop:4902 length:4788 start_codon:yes stop_codon:yes gene_type:complete
MASNDPFSGRLDFSTPSSDESSAGTNRATPLSAPVGVSSTPNFVPESSDQDFFTFSQVGDIGKGIGSGIIGIPEGIVSIPLLASDYFFDTNSLEYNDQFFQYIRDVTGLDPETEAGEVAELLSTFVTASIPVIGWASTAGKAGQAARAGTEIIPAATSLFRGAQTFGKTRAGQAILAPTYGAKSQSAIVRAGGRAAGRFQTGAATSVAAGLSDAIVAPGGTSTLADHFDVLPEGLRTEDDTGLVGRERAAARFRNKFRIFTESAATGVLIGDVAIPAVGATLVGTGKVAGGASQIVRDLPVPATGGERLGDVVSNGYDILGQKFASTTIGEIADKTGKVFNRYLTSDRGLASAVMSRIDDVTGNIKATEKLALKNLNSFHKEAVKYIKELDRMGTKGKETIQTTYDDLINYLEGDMEALIKYRKNPEKVSNIEKIAERMASERNKLSQGFMDDLTRRFNDGEFGTGTKAQEEYQRLRRNFKENEGGYLRRMFSRTIGRNEAELEDIVRNFADLEKRGTLPKKFKVAINEVMLAMAKLPAYRQQFGITQRANGTYDISNNEPLLREAADYVLTQTRRRVENTPGITIEDATNVLPETVEGAKGFKEFFKRSLTRTEPKFKVSEDVLKARSQILDDPGTVVLRELMGEMKEGQGAAVLRYTDTMSNLARIGETNRLYMDLLNNKELTATAEEVLSGAKPNPLIMDPGEMALLDARATAGELTGDALARYQQVKRDLVTLGESTDTVFGGTYGALSGNLVRKELVDVLQIKPYDNTAFGLLAGAGVGLKSFTQQAVVTYNPVALARNLLGGSFYLTAQGLLPRGGDLMDAFNLTIGKTGNIPTEAATDLFEKARRLRIVDESVRAGEIAETMTGTVAQAERNPNTSPLQIFARNLRENLDKIIPTEVTTKVGKGVKAVAKSPYTLPQKAQQFADSFYKLTAWVGERARYDGALRASLLDALPQGTGNATSSVSYKLWDDLADEFIKQGVAKRKTNGFGDDFFDVWTGDLVTSTQPSYFKISDVARGIIRTPLVGTFVGFMSETLRNAANTFSQAAKEMNFRATPEMINIMGNQVIRLKGLEAQAAANPQLVQELGSKAANGLARQMNAIGTKRMAGLGFTTFGVTGTASAISAAALGLTDEEKEGMDRSAATGFYEGQRFIYLTKPVDGKFEALPVGYFIPNDVIGSSANAGLQEYARGEKVGEASFKNALLASLAVLLRPFTDESLMFERVADVTYRDGRTKTGAIVYRNQPGDMQADDTGEIVKKSLIHLLGALTPVATDYFYEFDPTDPEGVKKGRVLKGLQGELSKSGQFINVAAEGTAMTTGLRGLKIDNKKKLEYTAREFSRVNTAGPGGELNAELRTDDVTPRKAILQWYDSQQEGFRTQQQLMLTANDAIATNVSSDDADVLLTENGVPKLVSDAALRGKFTFKEIGDKLVNDLYSEIEQDPGKAAFYRQLAQTPFAEREQFTPREFERIVDILNSKADQFDERISLTEPFPPLETFFTEEELGPNLFQRVFGLGDPSTLFVKPEAPSAPAPSAPAPAPSAPAPAPDNDPFSGKLDFSGVNEPVSPGLLGDNPVEIARNMELAQRTRRGV